MLSIYVVASSPDSKSNTEGSSTGVSSSEHELKSPFEDKSLLTEQKSQVSPSQQSATTPTLNGLISSEYSSNIFGIFQTISGSIRQKNR